VYTNVKATVGRILSPLTRITVNNNIPILYDGVVFAVHKTGSIPKTLRAVLAPKHERRDVKDDLEVERINFMHRLRPEEAIFFCVPMSDSDHLPLKDNTLW
jgi:hypothetical protein